jgi:hypothetical protein
MLNMYPLIANSISQTEKLILLVVCLVFWMFQIRNLEI